MNRIKGKYYDLNDAILSKTLGGFWKHLAYVIFKGFKSTTHYSFHKMDL